MLRPDGYAKVLDSEICKTDGAKAGSDGSYRRKQLRAAQRDRVSVGDGALKCLRKQARGQKIDARHGIWSLGVVTTKMGGRGPAVPLPKRPRDCLASIPDKREPQPIIPGVAAVPLKLNPF